MSRYNVCRVVITDIYSSDRMQEIPGSKTALGMKNESPYDPLLNTSIHQCPASEKTEEKRKLLLLRSLFTDKKRTVSGFQKTTFHVLQ